MICLVLAVVATVAISLLIAAVAVMAWRGRDWPTDS